MYFLLKNYFREPVIQRNLSLAKKKQLKNHTHLTHSPLALLVLARFPSQFRPFFAVVPVPLPAAVIIELGKPRCPRYATPTLCERRLQILKIKGSRGGRGGVENVKTVRLGRCATGN